ncbi:MAG TPA: hypothetical protein VE398_04205 [Acidobacteriota bacterium]|nr:hypothetical protein [Acidobacteriota bacterium]
MPHSCANTRGSALCEAPLESGLHLLDVICATKESIGEGLNDDELTCLLLLSTELPTEAGLKFLSFSGGVVTLSVPQQNLAKWYPDKGWIAPEKVKTAQAIANKYELSLSEPPDLASLRYLDPDCVHHHLELATRRETVVVAHPRYLKVRVYRDVADGVFTMKARKPLALGPELLQDLSALYRG